MKSAFFLPSGIFRPYFLLLPFLLSWFTSNAQKKIESEVNVHVGLASVYAGNLKDYYSSFIKQQSPFITTSNAHSNLGGYVAIGGRLVYAASPKLSLIGELNFTYQSSKIFLTYKWDSLDANYSGRKERFSSEASVQVFSLAVPVLMRYKLSERKNFFLITGFTFNFSPKPKLKSNEEHVETSYLNNTIIVSDLEKSVQSVKLDKFNPVNVMFSLGVEKKLKKSMKNWTIGIRGNYALTKTEMYTNNNSFVNSSFNNVVFSAPGKTIAEAFSGIRLNNFRMANYFLTFNYRIVGKVKKQKAQQ